jgi:hypothetical protein
MDAYITRDRRPCYSPARGIAESQGLGVWGLKKRGKIWGMWEVEDGWKGEETGITALRVAVLATRLFVTGHGTGQEASLRYV